MKKIVLFSVLALLILSMSVIALTVRIGDKTAVIQPPKTVDTTKTVTTAAMNNYQSSVSTLQANNNLLQERILTMDFKYNFMISEFNKIKEENTAIKQELKDLKTELCKINKTYGFC